MSLRPRPFVLVQTDHGSMIVNRFDGHRVPSGECYGVGHQLLSFGSFDKPEIDFVLDVLRNLRKSRGDGVVALDCGANIGVHTLEMASEMSGWGEVLAFEAQERLYYALCGNITLNNLFNARACFGALSNKNSSMKIPVPDYTRSSSFGSLELQKRPTTEYIGQSISYSEKSCATVQALTLDSFAFPRVDFVKIDVEGMEIEVLEGASALLDRYKPDLLIEWIKTGKDLIQDFLAPFGYGFTDAGPNIFASTTHI